MATTGLGLPALHSNPVERSVPQVAVSRGVIVLGARLYLRYHFVVNGELGFSEWLNELIFRLLS